MAIAAHEPAFGMSLLKSPVGELRVARVDMPVGARVRVRIRARDILIATERPRGLSALNIIAATIVGIRSDGAIADVTLDCGGSQIAARITRQSCEMLGLVSGQPVFAVIKAVSLDGANIWLGAEAPANADAEHGGRIGAMPSLSLRINLDPAGRIGPGKIDLLEEIDACGSISAAARTMNMSYKRAWDLVEELNRLFGKPVVATQAGGRRGGGATLTPAGLPWCAASGRWNGPRPPPRSGTWRRCRPRSRPVEAVVRWTTRRGV